MKHTLMKFSIIAAIAPLVAFAQIPPIPPTPPVAPLPPTPPVAPMPPMRVFVDPKFNFHFDYKYDLDFTPKLEDVQWHLKELEFDKQFAMEHAREQLAYSREQVQQQAEQAREQAQQAREQAREQAQQQREQVQQQLEAQRMQLEMQKNYNFNYNYNFNLNYSSGDKFLDARPRAPWAPEDAADSLYRLARESLNRGEYRRAASVFNELTKKYPTSKYALDAQYWEAFARYRSGTTEDLREALRILDEGKDKLAYLRQNESSVDVEALRTRVLGALASRGDPQAKKRLETEAGQQAGSCDREDVSVRAEALSALGQMDPASAMPVAKRVLARRDECTVELRRRALYLIGRQPTSDAVPTLLDVAKNEPNSGIRSEAMTWLSRVAGDQAIQPLEEILRTSQDESTQRSAVSALGQIDTERSRRAIRTIIERPDAQERVRQEAIMSLARDRDGRSMSADDITYLRTLYAKLESPRLKETVLSAVSRIESPENEQFLLGIARSETESPSMKASALQRLGRMKTVNLGDIAKLYEKADSRSMREQILQALSQRPEPEAIDRLVDVAKKDTDPYIRRYAIQLLSRSNNPKAIQGMKDLLGQ